MLFFIGIIRLIGIVFLMRQIIKSGKLKAHRNELISSYKFSLIQRSNFGLDSLTEEPKIAKPDLVSAPLAI